MTTNRWGRLAGVVAAAVLTTSLAAPALAQPTTHAHDGASEHKLINI